MLVELRGAESLACYLQIRKQVRVCGGWFCVLSPALESEYATAMAFRTQLVQSGFWI